MISDRSIKAVNCIFVSLNYGDEKDLEEIWKKPYSIYFELPEIMPTYLDAHEMGNVNEEQLKQALNMPKDELGVTHKDILYNKEENKAFCILDAPSKDAVEKHHQKFGMKCNWITEVKTVA